MAGPAVDRTPPENYFDVIATIYNLSFNLYKCNFTISCFNVKIHVDNKLKFAKNKHLETYHVSVRPESPSAVCYLSAL